VPVPPVPVPIAVIVVPEVTPLPVRILLTARTPFATAVTVSVVPVMLPVNCASANKPVPLRTPTIVPATGMVVPPVTAIVVVLMTVPGATY